MNKGMREKESWSRQARLTDTAKAQQRKKIGNKKTALDIALEKALETTRHMNFKKNKKGGNASGAEVPSEDNEEKSTHVKGEKRAQSVKK